MALADAENRPVVDKDEVGDGEVTGPVDKGARKD
jgi:hypothetical protein